MVRIERVDAGSLCDGLLSPGDLLHAINGHEIVDVLDYMYYTAERHLTLDGARGDGSAFTITLDKGEYDSIGLEFATYLIDKQRSCSNRCIFCFIDQLPKGMRKTLYFKDDDARMSFLRGNYITLTNLSEKDVERITGLKISPINISVQTTNPELRNFMMGNPRAGESLKILKRFADAGIVMNCQVVVCKGVNDGAELLRTLDDLIGMYPQVASISVVPVGITKYREGLHPLEMIDADTAADIISLTLARSVKAKKDNGSRIVYLADEFFLRAGMKIPESSYYEDYPQIENGVGLIASMDEEFSILYKDIKRSGEKRQVSLVTGAAAGPFIQSMVEKLKQKWYNLNCNVYAVPNHFFGTTVDVTGLVVGQDIIKELQGKPLGEELLVPAQMLRYDRDKFLDDVTLDELRKSIGVPVKVVEIDAGCFINGVLGKEVV